MTALTTTTSDLATFYRTAAEAIAIAGASAIQRGIDAEVSRMVSEPWRISEAVYGDPGWPALDMSGDIITPENVLADCRRYLQSEPLGKRRTQLNVAQLALMQMRDAAPITAPATPKAERYDDMAEAIRKGAKT